MELKYHTVVQKQGLGTFRTYTQNDRKEDAKIRCRCGASLPHPLDASRLSERRFNVRRWLTTLGETRNVSAERHRNLSPG